jgi:tRNA (guanine37-N1)-methyltransferase
MAVPKVLLGGDHEAVRRWRLRESLGRTWLKRPRLLEQRALNDEERELLEDFKKARLAASS